MTWWHLGGVFKDTDSTPVALFQYAVFGLYMVGAFYAYRRLLGYRLYSKEEIAFFLAQLDRNSTERSSTDLNDP